MHPKLPAAIAEIYAGRDRLHRPDPLVMHDRAVIIGAASHCVGPVFAVIKKTVNSAQRVGTRPDVGISVTSLMLVPEPDRVTDLMYDGSWGAVFVESD